MFSRMRSIAKCIADKMSTVSHQEAVPSEILSRLDRNVSLEEICVGIEELVSAANTSIRDIATGPPPPHACPHGAAHVPHTCPHCPTTFDTPTAAQLRSAPPPPQRWTP